MLKEHDVVALTEDLLADGLQKGDVGAVVHGYQIAGPASRLMKLNLLSLTGQAFTRATVTRPQ